MPTRPDPPDSLPQYLAEGVPEQSDEDLRALLDCIDDLLACRQDVSVTGITAGDDESIEYVDVSSEGTVVIKKVSCDKENGKRQRGQLHGPYKYAVRRNGETLNWDYRGPVDE